MKKQIFIYLLKRKLMGLVLLITTWLLLPVVVNCCDGDATFLLISLPIIIPTGLVLLFNNEIYDERLRRRRVRRNRGL